MNSSSNILITGGAGMLAKAILRVAAKRDVHAVALDRAALDIGDRHTVRAALLLHRPSVVINCAAYTKVDLAEQESDAANRANGTAPGILAEACAAAGVPVVHYSTDFVFDGKGSQPYRTEDAIAPLSAYGRSKELGEREVRQAAPKHSLIIRTAWLYGPGGACFPKTMVNAARAGKPLTVVADQRGAPTYTFDLAEATLDLLDRNARGTFHVTNGGETTWFEFTRAIVQEFGMPDHPVAPTTAAEWFKLRPTSAIRPAYSVLDLSKTESTIGRPMRPWREALEDYHAAVAAEGF